MQLQSKDSQKLPETRKRQGGASPESSEGTGPVHTLILYLAPAELWENKFLLFEVTQIGVICYSNPKTEYTEKFLNYVSEEEWSQ